MTPSPILTGVVMLWAILTVAAVACVLSEVALFRMFNPPDATLALLAGAWVAMPFLGSAGLAALLRKKTVALTVLLVSLVLMSFGGVSILFHMATQQAQLQQEVRDVVQPGEDPSHGPAGMRKSGAEAGAAIGDVITAGFVMFIPPVQLAGVVLPTLIGWGVGALVGRRSKGDLG
jgi:hypothetical protein